MRCHLMSTELDKCAYFVSIMVNCNDLNEFCKEFWRVNELHTVAIVFKY